MARLIRNRYPLAARPQRAHTQTNWSPPPPCLTRALLSWVIPILPRGTIWEAAAGDGRLAQSLRTTGRKVIATDLDPRGINVRLHDFIREPPPAGTDGTIIVTNPPYEQRRFDLFVGRALTLLDAAQVTAVALLLRGDKLMAASRTDALNRASHLLMCNWRVRLMADGNPRWSFTWVIWRAGHNGPPTIEFRKFGNLVQLDLVYKDR
jgi:hypothetical protein